MQPLASLLVWSGISVLGASAFGVLALSRGETVNAAWLLTAAVCTYAVGYRFYSKFLASRVFGLDDRRATPAERFNNGRDYVPTNKWVLFGHHFAAIAGAGPLVGPVLAAQFGFLPGTLWLVIGLVLGGAGQDFVLLFFPLRRDGKSLGQMAKEEVNPAAGATAMLAVLFIMIILLAVLALIVVNALKASPWGLFTIACTIPIALLMGWWMKRWRPGSVGEASAGGALLLPGALVPGGWGAGPAHPAPPLTHSATAPTRTMMGYGVKAPPPVGAGDPYPGAPPAAPHAGAHAVRVARGGPGVRGKTLSIRVHHDRVRGDLGIPLARGVRHHAQDDRARVRRPADRLRRHADGVVRGRDGDDRGLHPRSRRVLRDEHDARRAGAGVAGAGPGRVRGDSRFHARARGAHGRDHAAGPLGGRAVARGRDRPDLRGCDERAGRQDARRPVVPFRDHVRGPVHPHDHRHGDPRGPVHAAGDRGPRLAPVRRDVVVSECDRVERAGRGGMGIFPVSGRG